MPEQKDDKDVEIAVLRARVRRLKSAIYRAVHARKELAASEAELEAIASGDESGGGSRG